MEKSHDILQHVGYVLNQKSCDLNQNSLFNKSNKIINHWGSFFDPMILSLIFNATHLWKAGVGHVNSKQCHVTLFALVWHVELGSFIFLTPYHHHEIHLC